MAREGLHVRVKNNLVATAESIEPREPNGMKVLKDFAHLIYDKGSVELSAADVTSGTPVDVSKTNFVDDEFTAGVTANGATVDADTGKITIQRAGVYRIDYHASVEAEDVDAVGVIAKLSYDAIGAAAAERKEARSYGVIDDATGGVAGNHAVTLSGHTFVDCDIGDTFVVQLDFRAASAQKVGLLAYSFSVEQMTDSANV